MDRMKLKKTWRKLSGNSKKPFRESMQLELIIPIPT